jgi:D-Tyr-tRNAtyr deacylase
MLKQKYLPEKIKTGQFQAKMIVRSSNDGPVTLIY